MTEPSRTVTGFWFGLGSAWAIALALAAGWIWANPRTPAPPSPAAAAGCLPADRRARLPGFTARRTLPVNHWIGKDDLDWATPGSGVAQDAVLRTYVSCAVQAGERLVQQETRALPVPTVPEGRASQPLPLGPDPRLSATLNVGWKIDAWQNGVAVARGLPVLAVQCPSGQVPPMEGCTAVVAVSPDDAIRLRTIDPATVQIVIAATP